MSINPKRKILDYIIVNSLHSFFNLSRYNSGVTRIAFQYAGVQNPNLLHAVLFKHVV